MPYVDIRSSKPIDKPTRNALQLEIGKIMPTIPGKDVSNTLISICDCCTMYKDTRPAEAVFIDVRMYKQSPEDAKRAFVKKITALVVDILQVPANGVNLNFTEQPAWAVGGDYF